MSVNKIVIIQCIFKNCNHLEPQEQTSVKFKSKYENLLSRKYNENVIYKMGSFLFRPLGLDVKPFSAEAGIFQAN